MPLGPPRSRAAEPTGRSHVVDIARGLAIIGVVFNHAIGGLVGSGVITEGSVLAHVNAALYIFRMPALLFLVGLFVSQGVAKYRPVPYVRRRVALLLYLLVVWQLLQGGTELLTHSVRNGSTTLAGVLSPWFPVAHLWFLPFLALATVVCVVLRPWEGSLARRVVVTGACAGVAVATWGWDVKLLGLNGSGLIVFMVVGAVIGLRRATSLDRVGTRWAALVLVASVSAFVALDRTGLAPATTPAALAPHVRLLSILAALLGIVALLSVAVLLARISASRTVFASLGRATLPIYLAHVIVVSGARVVLTRLGLGPEIVLVVAVPLAVVVPLLLDRLGRGNALGWLFRIPSSGPVGGAWSKPAPRSSPGRHLVGVATAGTARHPRAVDLLPAGADPTRLSVAAAGTGPREARHRSPGGRAALPRPRRPRT